MWVPKGQNPPQIARRCCSSKEVLYTIFNSKGVLQTRGDDYGKFYKDSVLSEVGNLCKTARPNTGMRGYLAKDNTETRPQPAYSPYLAPCDLPVSASEEMSGRKKFKVLSALGIVVFQYLTPAYTQGGLAISISTMDWRSVWQYKWNFLRS